MSVGVPERPGLAAPAQAGGRDVRGWGVIAGPAVLAAVLSLIGLSGRSLGFDEGATVSIASQHGAALWRAIAHDGGNMSAYYLLMHVLIGVFGNGLVVLRLPSVIATVATVALIGVIAERLFADRRVTAAAGVLAAVSLPLIYWGQTARGYALDGGVRVRGDARVHRARRPGAGDAPRGDARRAGAAVAGPSWRRWRWPCTAASSPRWSSRRRWWPCSPGAARGAGMPRRWWRVAVLCVPLAVLAVRRGSGQLFWVQPPSRMVDTQVLQSLTSAGLQPVFHHSFTTKALMWVTLAAVVALVADTVARWRRGEPVWGMGLVLSWCVLPGALTFLYSVISHPVVRAAQRPDVHARRWRSPSPPRSAAGAGRATWPRRSSSWCWRRGRSRSCAPTASRPSPGRR